jgi:sarcosine oxidase
VLLPERCIDAFCHLARQRGAELHYSEPLLDWTTRAGEVEVHTAASSYTAGKLVLTVGAWASKLLDLPLHVQRIPVVWFEPRRPIELPIYIWDTGTSVFYGVPHLDWPGAKVGRHHQGQVVDPDTVDRMATDADEEPIREFVASRMPDLAGPACKRLICLYTNTPDEHFLIDQLNERVVFAAGFSGHGFKFASVVGEILADLALTGRATPDADFLRLTAR